MVMFQSRWTRRVALAFAIVAAASTILFGVRSYRSLILLRSAYQVGLPQSSSVRAWMTLGYVATAYHVSEPQLTARLELDVNTPSDTTLKALAEQAQIPLLQYVQRVQQALADSVIAQPVTGASSSSGWLDRLRDGLLSGLLNYGYPVLVLTLVLGAIGLPAPAGLAAAIAGSLSASGRLDWITVVVVGTMASVLGDAIVFGLGRWLGAGFLGRHGRWMGFTPSRGARLQIVFERWGAMLVLISRTLVSSLSSIVSFVAGMNGYRLSLFLALAVFGRVAWTSAYVGLGYGVGGSLDAATAFLGNLTGLILSLFIFSTAAFVASGRDRGFSTRARTLVKQRSADNGH
jgi:membrane protein DedA with SNARE-associated domain